MQQNLFSQPKKGMNFDYNQLFLDGSSYSFALNGAIHSNSSEGNMISLQNESSNVLKVKFPEGFVVIGRVKVIEQGRTIFALVNPETGDSEIGEILHCNYNDDKDDIKSFSACSDCVTEEFKERTPLENTDQEEYCIYHRITNATCLNFNIDYPVKIRYKITDCGINIYFTDKLNQRRFLYFDYENNDYKGRLLVQNKFKVVSGYDEENCDTPIYSEELDCNKLNYHPDYSFPCFDSIDVISGGSLKAGVYQFIIGYSDKNGNILTNLTPATNTIPVFTREITVDTAYSTTKAISLKIKALETSNLYGYYTVIVAETIDNFTSFKVVGTYPVTQKDLLYTGNETNLRVLTSDDIFIKRVFYKTAGNITDANDILLFSDLEEFNKPNYQRVANLVELYWKTIAVPENIYKDPKNTFNFRGYQRDEVYPLAIVFVKTNGEELGPYHIPGPSKQRFLSNYGVNVDAVVANDDVLQDTSCNNITRNKTWQVYNTGRVIGTPHEGSPECDANKTWEWGEFSYWESIKTYPNDPEIWGSLCGQPIRYHKFPDSSVTHIHDGLGASKDYFNSNIIYPIGIRVDHQSVINALVSAVSSGIILQSDVDELAGYRIVRGNRVGNKSVVAKGLLFDMWRYNKDGIQHYYPNYPYNDLRNDDFISNDPNTYQGGNNSNPRPNVLIKSRRYTFHSPDTHFNNPQIGTELKLETEEYGTSEGYFNEADEQARYKFLSTFSRTFAFAAGVAAAFSAEKEKECKTVIMRSMQNQISPGITAPGVPGVNFTPIPLLAPPGLLYDDFTGLATSVGGTDPLNPAYVAEVQRNTCRGKTFQLLNPLSGNPAAVFGQQLVYLAMIGLKEMEIMANLLKTLAPFKNFAIQYNSVGRYNNYKKVANSGNKIRKIERSAYLEPIMQLVNEAVNSSASQFTNVFINNWNRERSVYIKTDITKPMFPNPTVTDTSRNTLDNLGFNQEDLEKRTYQPISSYYASIKNFLPEQYGDLTDINYLETSNCIFKLDETYSESEDGLYGGDTFITRFALKRKMPFFLQTRFRMNDSSDVQYSELGNVGFPNYYFNVEEPLLERFAGNTFGGDLFGILTDILGVANTRLDAKKQKVFYQSGFIHLYNYGIPYFLAESDVNCDFRHGENSKEKDFYPHQQDLGYWLQEKNVPVTEDNYYFYNTTYSKQNRESVIGVQPTEIIKPCKTKYPFRIIHSEKGYNDNSFDNWLIFKANNLYDAPASYGRVVGLDGIENDKVLVRFENVSQIFNAYDVLQVDSTTVQVANGGLFQSRPREIASVSLGYGGSQHSDMLKTEFGHIWTDAKRGQIFSLGNNASGFSELSKDMSQWFKRNMEFQILKDFPNLDLRDIDNNYKGIGLHLSFDKRFNRFFITKLDYKKIHCDVVYNTDLKQFEVDSQKINLTDTRYFCNKSWTLSYHFGLKNWVSFHSFLPNYYIDDVNMFDSGINKFDGCDASSLWSHNVTNKSYQVYYGKLHPFVIELLSDNTNKDTVLNSIEYDCDVIRYHNLYDKFYNRNITFNKAIVWTDRTCSGLLELIPKQENNLKQSTEYPKIVGDSIQILTSNKDNKWRFNNFYDTVKSQTGNVPFILNDCANVDKELNLKALNYFKNDFEKQPIRGKQVRLKLINDAKSNYSFVFNFNETINSPVKS